MQRITLKSGDGYVVTLQLQFPQLVYFNTRNIGGGEMFSIGSPCKGREMHLSSFKNDYGQLGRVFSGAGSQIQ